MSAPHRIAILGLYNSGSSAVAGMLHRLGVNMGPPFWPSNDPRSPDKHNYESYDLAVQLWHWWGESMVVDPERAAERLRFLRCWAELQEFVRPGPLAGKHPLLSLCGDDIIKAWGLETRIIWSWRPLDQSIAGLERRGWLGSQTQVRQVQLWETLNNLEARHNNVFRLCWEQVKRDPQWAARELASLARITPTEDQLKAAAGFVMV